MELTVAAQAFHRDNLFAGRGQSDGQAGADRFPIQQNGAGPAISSITSPLRACNTQLIPQNVKQRIRRGDQRFGRQSVNGESQNVFHTIERSFLSRIDKDLLYANQG
jgi:hypothetical protein